MDSWRSVLANIRPKAFQIDLEDVRIFASDNHAFVTCIETINADENKGRCVFFDGDFAIMDVLEVCLLHNVVNREEVDGLWPAGCKRG